MIASGRIGRWLCLWSAGYAALMVAVVWSLFSAREWARAELTKPQSTTAWETWRGDVRADQGRPVSVRRRVPKSAEPPALVLTRDFFGVSLGGAVIFSSLLYWVIAWFVTGIFTSQPDAASAPD